jgi:hypothetical protein
LLIIVNSTGSVKYVLCTERCLPMIPGVGSGSRPARMSATIAFWPGMMWKNTFAAIIVPIIAPTWMYAARAPKTWKSPHAAAITSASTTTARMFSLPASSRHAKS